jgi:alkylhydroperoxidase family enzyme
MIDALRNAVRPAPPEFAAYLEKVRLHAYKVTDADVEELKALGFDEDEIFEHTVSAAVAAGLERLDAGMAVLP